MKGISNTQIQGPQSSAGIMSMFGVTGGGPKISPMVVVGVCIAFILIEIIASVIA